MSRYSFLFRPLLFATLVFVVLFSADHFLMPNSSPSSATSADALETTTIVTGARPSSSRQHRILCYGDSLTAGSTNDSTLHPYAPFLEQGLKAAGRDDVLVRHVGLPGWTARQMVDTATEEQGLETQIRRVQDPGLSLVILLAGTNDLGHGYSQDDITSSVLKLHDIALDNQVPATLAIEIPPSGYTSRDEGARAIVAGVNEALHDASTKESRLSFAPFPFEFEFGGENWSPDTLHMSPKGYQRLGESLVAVVEEILAELD